MTVEEFDAIEAVDEYYKYELIGGVLIVGLPALLSERASNDELGHWLLSYKEQHPEGGCLDFTIYDQYVGRINRRRSDRVIWAGLGRKPDPLADFPTIIVEFLSTGKRSWKRDCLEKRKEYLDGGVVEYWVIDRFVRTLSVYRGPSEVLVTENDVYRTPVLPGFELSLPQ
jgi:Uma2 family endonuclease